MGKKKLNKCLPQHIKLNILSASEANEDRMLAFGRFISLTHDRNRLHIVLWYTHEKKKQRNRSTIP